MTTENAIQLVKSTSDIQFFVYYDEWTGDIISVTRTELEIHEHPFIVTTNELAKKIIQGTANEKLYQVAFNEKDEPDIMLRDNVIRLRSSEKKLHHLVKKKMSDWNIRVKLYTGNNKLQLEINPLSVRRLSSMTFNKNISINPENDLTLYVIKHNQPDHFLEKINVDVVELLTTGNIVYDVAPLRKYASLQDIGILTRRCFKNYYLEILPESLSIIQQTLVKNRTFIFNKVVKNSPKSHILIEQRGNHIIFSTELSSTELDDLGLSEDTVWFNLVGKTPDEYYGRLPVNIRDLKHKKLTTLSVDDDISQYNILHKKQNVLFSLRTANK